MKSGRQLAEVESFAQRVIHDESAGSSVAVDDSLGSYIISCLQNSDSTLELSAIPEFDALVELLQEHCHISHTAATRALRRIFDALRSGPDSPYSSVGLYDKHHQEAVPISPQAAGSLLPLDLLNDGGAGRQQWTSSSQTDNPVQFLGASKLPSHGDAEAFPPLGSEAPVASKKPVSFSKNTAETSSRRTASAEEVMSSLFQTRSRQSSIDETARTPAEMFDQVQQEFQDYHYATSEWLLSMNAELSQEAAMAASMMAQADVSLAQYVIEATIAQVPICRHFVAGDGCYRADCTFSHDIDNHTCLFWLKSRCINGSQCRFKHGFSDQLLQTVEYPTSEFGNYTDGAYHEQPIQQQHQEQHAAYSFANIASHGYDTRHSFSNEQEFPSISSNSQQKTLRSVPIPNDLWNVHENRDASVFYIADPMERYAAVQQQTGLARGDVIDLHFQSLQTFPFVLDEVLETKLRSNESVWIITGTGHHVGNRTHQKGGGALENAVVSYLKDSYDVRRGRDRGGQGGAILVRKSR